MFKFEYIPKKIHKFCLIVVFATMPLLQQSEAKEKVLLQLLDVVEQPSDHTSIELLAKIAVVSGQTAVMGELYKDGGVPAILSFINDCYDKSIKSQQMKNIMACYVMDYEIAELIERSLKKKGFTSSSDQRLTQKLISAGIKEPQIINLTKKEFLEKRIVADKWLSSHTIANFMQCSRNGVGSSNCK